MPLPERNSIKADFGDKGVEKHSFDNTLSRMVQGLMDPDRWFLSEWRPHYEVTVNAVKRALAAGAMDDAVDVIWRQKDNSVSNAGQGVLASQEIDSHREFFRGMTSDIARDPSPAMFDEVLVAAERERDAGRLSMVPRLLIARAFATIAPDRYHTTVDREKHERVISWFEKHTSFRSTAGNWAHRASELSRHLAGVRQFGDSVLVRNMFPWFVFTQLANRSGRPAFTPGHRSRVRSATGHGRPETQQLVLRHNFLVERLYAALIDEHGDTAVGTEQPSGLGGFVDVVVRLAERRYWIYEVKVSTTASDAIRQAVGQLLEYAYRDGAWNPQKMFVVGEVELDAGSRQFLSRLRTQFRLPIEYRQITG